MSRSLVHRRLYALAMVYTGVPVRRERRPCTRSASASNSAEYRGRPTGLAMVHPCTRSASASMPMPRLFWRESLIKLN
jgi:hypothetical protein